MEEIIVKFLTKEANIDELRQLELWLNNPENEKLFFQYIRVNNFSNISTSTYNVEIATREILKRIRRKKRHQGILIKYAAAAVLIGVCVSGFLFKNKFINTTETPVIANTNLKPGNPKATLTLENDTEIALEEGSSYRQSNFSSNGKQLVYENQNTKKISYNYLTIPRGGEFYLELSDGTSIWLNSETKLKYPSNFNKGETRIVELVYGEAYFQVSPSSKNGGSSFKVYHEKQEIQVLGTEFNVKAYKDESSTYTTLVEGKVNINLQDKATVLTPKQQLKYNTLNDDMEVYAVDVYNEISWKDGVFSFDETPLKDIMRVLSRWYDIDISIENKDIENEEFIGLLRKDQNLENIILTIIDYGIIETYELKDNMLIIK